MPPIIKNLGPVAAMIVGTTAPSNKKILWYDDNPGQKRIKFWNTVTLVWEKLYRDFDATPTSGSGNLVTSGGIYDALQSVGLVQFTQVAHGFSKGDIIRYNGTDFVKALADTTENARMVGMVSEVVNANTFKMMVSGYVSGLSLGLGLVAGTTYYLSDTIPGRLATVAGTIPKPCVQTITTTSLIFINAFGLDV